MMSAGECSPAAQIPLVAHDIINHVIVCCTERTSHVINGMHFYICVQTIQDAKA